MFTSAALKYAGKGGKELENSNKYIKIGEKYHLCFKMIRCSQTLIRIILHMLFKKHKLQRVNHFPRSFLLTRKDKLYECLRRAQILFGISYNIIPEFFVTPKEYKKLEDHFNAQTHGLKPFIVKPVASSRGNGIFIAQSPRDIPLGSTMLVSRYIETPYLLNGYKFDLRFVFLFPMQSYIFVV
ncbi:unnamed protein product [Thelazia callipaeda]|uniref:Tubulin--tyrosine ligase-like protein 5 n=1 Tax=Thelazia callipaeda TaxID=103827 RepID=A0A0N5CQE1_THECL|nr:unnamed protein product [Thelazia callipaeda]